jgi:hypothetical protein
LKSLVVGVIMLIFYVAVFIPFILPVLSKMFVDWINNSGDFLVQQYCFQRQVLNTTSGKYDTITECTTYDFRPLIVFLFNLSVYFIAPIILIYRAVKGRW